MDNVERNVVIRPCGCVSAYQDEVYGPRLRVHNIADKGSGSRSGDARCTVCGTVHGPVVKTQSTTSTKTTGVSRMGGRKAGKKGKKQK